MKCPECDGYGKNTKGWIPEPCSYCGGTGTLPDDFAEITKLKKCKKCGGEAVFSGVFDDPTTYRFPECMKCGTRAEGNSTNDSWAERARKWNEQNTLTRFEYLQTCTIEEMVDVIYKVATWTELSSLTRMSMMYKEDKNKRFIRDWLKEKCECT